MACREHNRAEILYQQSMAGTFLQDVYVQMSETYQNHDYIREYKKIQNCNFSQIIQAYIDGATAMIWKAINSNSLTSYCSTYRNI